MKLCELTDIPSPAGQPGSLRITPQGWHNEHGICVVRDGMQVYAYENRCPHMLMPMDWIEGQFLTADKQHIQCAVHGALFRPEDGHCVAGPCTGQRLQRIPVSVINGQIMID